MKTTCSMMTELTEALSPRGDSAIEWWFIHGFFGDGNGGNHAFMTSFFRHRVEPIVPGGIGHSQLISLLDLENGSHFFSSRINSALVGHFLGSRKTATKMNVDPGYIELLMREVHARGPLQGIQVDGSPVRMKEGPLRIDWGDFLLNRADNGIELCFSDPDTKTGIRLKLEPQSALIGMENDGASREKGMNVFLRSYPRLRLSGFYGESKISGEAWLDHQWGDHVLHRTIGTRKQIVGWDWFGIHLDDGSNWLFMGLRDALSRRIIYKFLSIQKPTGELIHLKRFGIEQKRSWESPRTGIVYPVQWRLKVPDLDADFLFTPFRDDQEIPVFGGMRAIWEGAGQINGTLGRKPVLGRARGEFQGYGYVFDFDRYWKNAAARVDRRVRKFFPKRFTPSTLQKELGPGARRRDPDVLNEMIAKPVWDLLERGGKRWRPIFTICLLSALGVDPRPFEVMVCTLSELTHAGALIVDDIEDSSELRRGGPCTYLRYGIGPSINAANTLYFLSTLPVFEHPDLTDLQKLEIHNLIQTYHVRAHFGQAQDIYWSENMSPSNLGKWLTDSVAGRILQMYEDKTAGPVMGLAETAAVIAHSTQKARRICREFSRNLGVAFQIVDDIHDFAENPGWSKKRGDDLAEGKMTYVIIRALEMLEKTDRKRLNDILCRKNPHLTDTELAEGIDLVCRSGALSACGEAAKKMYDPAWEKLARQLPPSEAKVLLGTLCRHLTEI